ncbi:MFS transporter [Corynebacterium ulceribovis]|uniref:MFS transporter n=1 Tax=Corynebacterium ulceribovis TaxID=487732 RepID=UPI000381AD85|nr:MFS transporter [Corynebacterium ulceribovis]
MTTSPAPNVNTQKTVTTWNVVGVALMFASNGALLGVLAPWYPSFVQKWLIDEATFGLVVACMPLGALLAATLPAWAAKRFGPLRAVGWGTAAMALLLGVVGWLPGGQWIGGVSAGAGALGAVLLGFGALDAVVDVSQNVCGVRVEQRRGRSIMSSLHACWSLGAAGAGAAATAVALSGAEFRGFIVVAGTVIVLVSVLGCWQVGAAAVDGADVSGADVGGADVGGADAGDGATTADAPATRKLLSRPVLMALLPLAAIAIAAVVVEDVATNWASIAAVELTGIDVSAAGMTFALIVGSQTVGRFTGDPLINKFGRANVARVGGLLIAVGSVLVVTASAAPVLMAGFMLSGFGCGTLVPSVFAVAARLPAISDSGGLTIVSWLMRVGFLVSSPIVGAVASAANLRVALGIVVLSGMTVVLFASALRTEGRVGRGAGARS